MTDAALPALPEAPRIDWSNRRWLRFVAYLTRGLRHGWRYRNRKPTPEELAARERARQIALEQKALEKQLNVLAGDYSRLIINALTRVGAARLTKEDGHQVIRAVRLHKPARVNREALYFQVDTNRLPWRVKLSDLYNEDTIETLMAACNRVVEPIWDRNAPEKGFWYAVWLKEGVRGIPRLVELAPMLADIPKSASRYTVAVGRGVARRPVYLDFAETPHLLIGGATGQGKTVCIEGLVLTLAMQNTPRQLRFYLIDLKNGADFSQFGNLPHLYGKIIKDTDKVIPILESCLNTIKQRQTMFESRGVVKIEEWNQRRHPKLPRIFIVIDELAELMYSADGPDADELLARIGALGRSAGVHAIICTQRPEARVIAGRIQANFTTRFAFACADITSSKVVLGTGDAYGLKPKGRMIYMDGADKTELQSPYVTSEIIADTITLITGGKPGEALAKRKRHNFTWEDFVRHAIQHYPGRFPVRPIYEDLKAHGVTKEELFALAQQHEGEEFEVDGGIYTLTGSVTEGVKESRQLILLRPGISDAGDDDEADAEPLPDDLLGVFQPIALTEKIQMPPLPDADDPPPTSDPSDDDEPELVPINTP